MCGIAGELSFDGRPGDPAWARRAGALMQHRGPDGEGIFTDPGVAFVHRRLAIIDLGSGAQPMSYAGDRYWTVFNGEIYNYRELRTELEGRGLGFRTRSDTEVILAAYSVWGLDALSRLSGIFAFALWDRETRALLLARDHVGVKPLLYHLDPRGLRFASEFKALLAHPDVEPRVDGRALREYLGLGYVMSPRTIVAGVCKLPAGHYLLARDGKVHTEAYWDLASVVRAKPPDGRSDADQAAAFDALLERAVTRQMVSDVPLGSFLSGGLDSSTIAYYASRHATGPLQTFSMGFAERGFSEVEFAERVATHLGTAHRQATVRAKSFDELSDLVWYYDEPLGDTSIVPTYDLALLARQHVTVALSGDGCDEILAGYDTYLADLLHHLYTRIPGWLHRHVVVPAARWIPSTYGKVALDFKIKQFVAHGQASPERAHFGWRRMLDDDESSALLGTAPGDDEDPFLAYRAHFAAVAGAHPLDQALYVDVKTWLVDDILPKVDRATMACGLEARVPFLSPEVVEAAFRLPVAQKLRRLERKVILRRVMRNRLPREILTRQKRGFNAPVSSWMRGPLRADVQDLFARRDSTIVDLGHPVLARLWREHSDGRVDHGHKLWTLVSLALWEKRVLGAAGNEAARPPARAETMPLA